MGLRPVTIYEFETGQLRGYLRGVGASPGIQITAGGEKGALTAPRRSLMTLTHYLSNSVAGPEAPLNIPARSEELTDDVLQTRVPPTADWPVDTLISFLVGEGGCIDICFHFHFRKEMLGFEAQVTSTFAEHVPVAHVHAGGDWFRPALKAKEICFFARDEHSAKMIEGGRWDFYLARGFNVVLDERGYDFPLLVCLEEKSGCALVQMLMTDECPSICLSSSPRQHNFSLVGRSVKAKEEITCHARLAYGQFRGLDGILPLYHKFIREVREGVLDDLQAFRSRTPATR